MVDGIHFLGIRHHGPGSAKNVKAYLEELEPDIILLEGPPEAEPLLARVLHEQMKPPVALLAYQPDEPRRAVFYPFAEFSPEWQSMCYAVRREVPLRFFDLPLVHHLAFWKEREEQSVNEKSGEEGVCDEIPGETSEAEISGKAVVSAVSELLPVDPFAHLAKAAGYDDPELWWEVNFENRQRNEEVFAAVKEAVSVLREYFPKTDRETLLREAWMRKMIRAAQKENFERIVVVCGAWHVPALDDMPKVKDDNELLKGLPKVKVECTWIPWTYDRLAFRSGYGAGIESPGWYHYLWHHPEDDGTLWVSRIASLLRQKNMDISVAHVIETVRLAQVTAALRDLPYPSLNEYNEAVTTVMGFGDDILLQIIKEELIISNRLGSVPDDVPKVPLLVDVEKIQKRLRVPFTAEIKELILDLRKPNDLERSIFFHRLQLLGIDWTILGRIDGKGTFKEKWTLYHKPEQIIQIIERAIWGNTVMEATQKYLLKQMAEIQHIPELTALLSTVLPADLPALVEAMTVQLDRLSAASTDILEMMEAVPDLVNIVRYGNVRNLDFSKVGDMLEAMIARILAGGVLVCINIDEEAAGDLLNKLVATDYALSILNREELNLMWRNFIGQVRSSANVHPLLSGYATRLLNDKGEISAEEMETTLSFYSSVGNAPADMAYWFEGFLRSSGSILLLDDRLWNLVNNWVCSQDKETFMELLPVLRRTFSEFTSAERRKLGEKARRTDSTGTSSAVGASVTENECLNREEAKKVIPVIRQLLGLETK